MSESTSCYHTDGCNCLKECNCPDGYECCYEHSDGVTPTFGHCVLKGMCNNTTGLCDTRQRPSTMENFAIFGTTVLYDDNRQLAIIIMIEIIILSILFYLIFK